MSNIRVFNFDIQPDSVVGIFAKTQMPVGAWNVYITGDNDDITWCWIVDSDDPESAKFPFQGIWLTDGSEIYILNANHQNIMALQVLFTPVIPEQTAPTQEFVSV